MMLKGSSIGIPPIKTIPATPRVVLFQYNPETVTRNLSSQFLRAEPTGEVAAFSGAPTESITMDIQIESIDAKFALLGVRPQIAMLQLMTFPSLKQVVSNQTLMKAGQIAIAPLEVPRTMFIFGATQVIPVNVTSVNVVEEFFDSYLNPIRAKISLSLDVTPNYDEFLMAYHAQLEVLAAAGLLQAGASMVSSALSAF